MAETEPNFESIPYENLESLQELEIVITKRLESGQVTQGEAIIWQGGKIVRTKDKEVVKVGEKGCIRIDVRVGARGNYRATIDPADLKDTQLPPAWQPEENP